ncbi:hypothetical protein MVES_003788 [Malassezia vespertilionis]|uniref:Signal peptidase complex subunit 2 n=1 Tax=Malassezia vespertilionis TaxID=2020962 RepID=A0A2N1J6Y1_9BASI|nr:hypothetical protein MVES_003788 [Malassezia vespertilionis]
MAKAQDAKQVCNLANVKDLKIQCDDTIERVLVLVSVLYTYWYKISWEHSKQYLYAGIGAYVLCQGIQLLVRRIFGVAIFMGSRTGKEIVRALARSPQNETEWVQIKASSVGPSTLPGKKAADGKPVLIPPTYAVDVKYTRSIGGRVLGSKDDHVVLGSFGEWFRQDGEFVESIFAERLRVGLQKVMGE